MIQQSTIYEFKKFDHQNYCENEGNSECLSMEQQLNHHKNETFGKIFHSEYEEQVINPSFQSVSLSVSDIFNTFQDKNSLQKGENKTIGNHDVKTSQTPKIKEHNNNKMGFVQKENVNEGEETENKMQFTPQDIILKQINLKKRMKKNTNVPKFLVRVYMKYHEKFRKQKNLKQFEKQVLNSLNEKNANNFKILHILKLLDHQNRGKKKCNFHKRKMMSEILQKTRKKQILANKYISNNKLSYLIISKIYAIRCRNSTLTERTQFF